MKNYKLYKVGGVVRDELLGLNSKDIDYAFEFDNDFVKINSDKPPCWFYEKMNNSLEVEGFEIFLSVPDCFTTRARFPKDHVFSGQTADFVLCRNEVYLDSESRKPTVVVSDLQADLSRRDFKMNAIAIDVDSGELIDPFDGKNDIENKIIDTVNDPSISFSQDYLRVLRAVRFYVTKEFHFSDRVRLAIRERNIWENLDTHVSRERIREELTKMFFHNTRRTLAILDRLNYECGVYEILFQDDLKLIPKTSGKWKK